MIHVPFSGEGSLETSAPFPSSHVSLPKAGCSDDEVLDDGITERRQDPESICPGGLPTDQAYLL